MSDHVTTCYLCGKQINKDGNEDHVPPKQFFGKELRKQHNPDLEKLPTHRTCNSSYQLDEDYFVTTLMPFISESYSGRSVYNDVKRRFDEGKKVGLVRKVYEEFDSNPSGLILPADKILKRFEGQRIRRIVWKITRGLYFLENNLVLPEKTKYIIEYALPNSDPTNPEYELPKIFLPLLESTTYGKYPDVFGYRYIKHKHEDTTWNIWGLVFWDRILTTLLFHDVSCKCQVCILKNGKKN